ncbi:hypothetical protein SprV_0100366300 [Sparganum proliferum]
MEILASLGNYACTDFPLGELCAIEDEALEIKISPDRTCFVVALSSGIIRIFFMEERSNRASALRLKAPGEKMPCNALAFTSVHKASKSKHNQHLLAMWKFADFVLVSPTHARRRSSINYSNPINEFVLEGPYSKTQGYVAKFGISGHLVFFTGTNNNILRIIDMENMAVRDMRNM